MKKKRQSYLLNLLKATRIKRTLPILIIMLIPAAYSNKFPLSLLLLGLVAVLIYSAASIHNAYRDRDYKLPQYSKKIMFVVVLVALLLASLNKIILITSIIAVFLGYIYNTVSRFVVYGDTFVAGLTHFVLPIIASSLLVGIEIKTIVSMTIVIYFIAICIGPVTNLKDIRKDKIKGYKTLVNTTKKPYTISTILFAFSFIFIYFLYLLFEVNSYLFLLLVPIFLLNINQIYNKHAENALNLMRFYLIISFVLLILILTSDKYVIFSSLLISFVYLSTLLFGFRKFLFRRNN